MTKTIRKYFGPKELKKFLKKHRTHIQTFISGFIADMSIEGYAYLQALASINEDQLFDMSFWNMIFSGLMLVAVRSIIKTIFQLYFPNFFGDEANKVFKKKA